MLIAVVPSSFPVVSETFIVRHVAGLNAEVFCPAINSELLHRLVPKPPVFGIVRTSNEVQNLKRSTLINRALPRLKWLRMA